MKHFFFVIYILSFFAVSAQETNKKKVLVIPYNRFEFVSEFELEDIAQKNELTTSEVFLAYQKSLLTTFETYKDENFEFIPVKHHLIKPCKSFIKYENGKFNGKRYNAVNLKTFSEESFTKLLEQHGADFVIFITWYDIQKESFVRAGKHNKRVPYAGHYIDYDVFNLFKQRVVGEGRIKAKAKEPNDLEASFSLLRTQELAGAYQHFIAHVVEQLNNPIQ